MNKVLLSGRIANEIELMKTKSGKSVMRFSLAVPKDKEKAIFPTIILWDKQAEYVDKFGKKGMRAIIEGHYDIRNSESKGKVYVNHEINAERIELIFDKKEEPKEDTLNLQDDDLPF